MDAWNAAENSFMEDLCYISLNYSTLLPEDGLTESVYSCVFH